MKLYTDGACSSKTLRGGYAVILEEPNNEYKVIACAGEEDTTNNRMELKAVLAALEYVQRCHVCATIYTDSAYIANCFKDKWYVKWELNGWKTSTKEPVKNKDLWEDILQVYNTINMSSGVTIEKVTGHSNNKYNNLADTYAVKARNGEI